MKKIFFLSFIFLQHNLQAQAIPNLEDLSLDEKIGQLIMMATISSSDRNQEFIKQSPYILNMNYTEKIIRDYAIGGVIFLGAGSPQEQYKETERLQLISKYPLLVGLDAEWGLAMRHQENVIRFPRAMTLGALSPEDDHLINELGKEIGFQCRALGVHINFAPVVDVNNNPRNPIINTRSFGESAEKVAHKASLFMHGMQSAGILACAKHFPGHGDVEIDSHYQRGIINRSQARLNEIELFPFKYIIDNGIDAIMTAHLDVPSLAGNDNVPATLSHNIITTLLRKELNFHGLIITDALGMKGVADDFNLGELELQALKAGNDILLCPIDIPRAIARIKRALQEGELHEKDLDAHVERVLSAKRKAIDIIDQKKLLFDLSYFVNPHAQMLKEKLYQAAVTLVRVGDGPVQLPLTKEKKIVVKTFGNAQVFVQSLAEHISIEHFQSDLFGYQDEFNKQPFDNADQIIVSIHLEGRSGMIEMQNKEGNSLPASYLTFIAKYAKKIILVIFGNPYNLAYFSDVPIVVVGYENEPEAQRAVAQALLGLYKPTGILPVTA